MSILLSTGRWGFGRLTSGIKNQLVSIANRITRGVIKLVERAMPGLLQFYLNQNCAPGSGRLLHRVRLVSIFRPQIVCLGDSVMQRISKLDSNKDTLGQALQRSLSAHSPKKIATLSCSALNMETYALILRIMLQEGVRPKIVILPINLRSFSWQWFSNPQFQNDADRKLLYKFLNDKPRHLTCPAEVYGKHVKDWVDILNNKTDGNFFFRQQALYKIHYLYKLSTEHPLFGYMQDIIELGKEKSLKVIFYFTPINCESGVAFCGEDFIACVNKNKNILMEFIKQQDASVHVLDFSFSASRKMFFHDNETTEHLNEFGRGMLAKAIAQGISG